MDIKKAIKAVGEQRGVKNYVKQKGSIVKYEDRDGGWNFTALGKGVEFDTKYKGLKGYLLDGNVYFTFGTGKERDYYKAYVGNMLHTRTQDILEEYMQVIIKEFLEKCTAFVNEELSIKTQLVEETIKDLISNADSYGVILGDEYIKTSVVTKLMENISKMFSKYIVGEKKGVFSFFK